MTSPQASFKPTQWQAFRQSVTKTAASVIGVAIIANLTFAAVPSQALAAGLLGGIFAAKTNDTNALRALKNEATNEPATYVVPNEFDNYRHFDQLQVQLAAAKNAVISVGTLRAFNTAAVLRRDALVSFDFSPGIVEFNNAIATLISQHSRAEFLALILGEQTPLALSGGEAERQDLDQLIKVKTSAMRNRWESGDRSLGLSHEGPMAVIAKYLEVEAMAGPLFLKWLTSIRSFAKTPKRYQNTFFGTEANYQHLQNLIKSGHYHGVVGSLAGKDALRSVGSFLQHQGFLVTEVDVSNALHPMFTATGIPGYRAFASSLAALPLSPDASLLVTENLGMEWDYHIYNPEQFITSMQAKDLAQNYKSLLAPALRAKIQACRRLLR